MSTSNDVKNVGRREKYGQAAVRVKAGQSGCCSSAPRGTFLLRPDYF